MAATRFEGSGPVARYWLANCEGFAVRGGAHGTVEELLRDADPFVTTRLVVRRGRRRTVIPAASVAAVVPDERVVVVERPRREPRVRPAVAASARRAGDVAIPAVRSAAASARTATERSAAIAGPPVRAALARAAAVLGGSFSSLAREVRATGRGAFRTSGARTARR
jgi:hypothetical protein